MPTTLYGDIRVIDGDTIDIGGERVRLQGIDAPERKQRGRDAAGKQYFAGRYARLELVALCRDHAAISVRVTGRDKYGRYLGRLHGRRGADLNQLMVRAGWAFAYAEYDRSYVADERAARQAGIGLWSGEIERPSEWRREHKAQPSLVSGLLDLLQMISKIYTALAAIGSATGDPRRTSRDVGLPGGLRLPRAFKPRCPRLPRGLRLPRCFKL